MTELDHQPSDVTYLDNAATVYPKPKELLDGAIDLYRRYGVNPGRSGYDLCVVGEIGDPHAAGDLLQELS